MQIKMNHKPLLVTFISCLKDKFTVKKSTNLVLCFKIGPIDSDTTMLLC